MYVCVCVSVCMCVRVYVCMDGWMNGWMNGWMDGWMDGWWIDGWMDRWMDGWVDGWMAEDGSLVHYKIYIKHSLPNYGFASIDLSISVSDTQHLEVCGKMNRN